MTSTDKAAGIVDAKSSTGNDLYSCAHHAADVARTPCADFRQWPAREPHRRNSGAVSAFLPAVPRTFSAADFAADEQGWIRAANVLAMRAAGRSAVGLCRLLGSRAGNRIGILTYHRVTPVTRGLPAPTHNVTPNRFRAQLAGLLRRGFAIRPLRELLERSARGEAVPPRTIALTFDDGFESVYTHAWPVLRELGVSATVFLATAYIGSAAPFPFDQWGSDYADRLQALAYRPLTFAHCREMADNGLIDFGAHTHTHRDLRRRPDEFRQDLQTSVDFVRTEFGLEQVMFAFPYGSRWRGFAGPALVAAARQTGVVCGLTTECSLIDIGSDPFQWGRFNVFHWDTAETLAAKLGGWYTWAAHFKRQFRRRAVLSAANACERPASSGGDCPESSGRDSQNGRTVGSVPFTSIVNCAQAPAVETPSRRGARGGTREPLADRVRRAHVVNLVNILHPSDRQMYLRLAERVGRLTILLSSRKGLHGVEPSDWASLDVRLQHTFTIRRPQRHPLRFREMVDIHVPWDTLSQLSELRPDVVLSHETGIRSLLSAVYTVRNPRVPLLLWVGMTAQTERGRGWARYLLRRWLFRRADAVLVNGPATESYVSGFGVPAERMFTAPYVTLPEASYSGPPTRDPSAAHRLLFVGQFVERKGLLPFLSVLAAWAGRHPERKVDYSLVGSGPLEDVIRRFPLPPNVEIHLLGRHKPLAIAQFHAAAGIFVLPTLADEWGLVVNEAMASGLPVLGSVYSQAVESLCTEGKTGWTFRPDQRDEMERALDAAMNTPVDVLDQMRALARQRVAHLTADYVADLAVEAIGRSVELKQI